MGEFKQINDLLSSDIKKLKINISKNVARKIADELRDECRNAIEDFYSSYDPIYYYRHMNFRKSFRRYYEKHGDNYVGGVELLEDSLPDVYSGRNSDPTNVFWRVYTGLHGIASIQGYAPSMKMNSPYNRLLDKQQEIIKNKDKYINEAVNIAMSDSYNLIG